MRAHAWAESTSRVRFKQPKPGNRVCLRTFNWSTTVVTSFSNFVVRSTPQLLLVFALRFSRALMTASSYRLHKEFMGANGRYWTVR